MILFDATNETNEWFKMFGLFFFELNFIPFDLKGVVFNNVCKMDVFVYEKQRANQLSWIFTLPLGFDLLTSKTNFFFKT